jgi:hypothetical protein
MTIRIAAAVAALFAGLQAQALTLPLNDTYTPGYPSQCTEVPMIQLNCAPGYHQIVDWKQCRNRCVPNPINPHGPCFDDIPGLDMNRFFDGGAAEENGKGAVAVPPGSF